MIIENVGIDGLKLITPKPFFDERGYFSRIFCQKETIEIKENLVIAQINNSFTKKKGTIRGMHFQYPPHAEIKIVRCVRGKIFDVGVDLRKDSPTFLQWHGEILSAENQKMFVIPEGFAHGFQTLEDDSEIIYFNTAFYNKEFESAISYKDPKIGIKWLEKVTVVSEKDANHPYIKEDFALPPIKDIEKKITSKTKGIIVCNPNNPTGYLYSKEELLHLKEIVKKYDLYLFSDEAYREFCYDGAEHFSAMNLESIEKNVILLDSVSKRYSECGVRIGALITRNKDVISTTLKFAQARLSPPGLGQIVGEASIDTSEEYFEEVNKEYTARRNFMVDALNKIPGVYCPKPKGAFYTIVKLPVDDADKFAQWLLEEFEYNNQTVMVAPASGFYSTPGSGRNEVRIAYVLKIDDLKNAMRVLAEALKVYPGRV